MVVNVWMQLQMQEPRPRRLVASSGHPSGSYLRLGLSRAFRLAVVQKSLRDTGQARMHATCAARLVAEGVGAWARARVALRVASPASRTAVSIARWCLAKVALMSGAQRRTPEPSR